MINAALFISWALAVVLFDCRSRRIPNWLVIAGLAVACALVASGHSPFHIDLSDAALGLIAGLILLLPFYLLGLMGAAGIHALYLIASAVIELKRKTAASVDTYVSDAHDIAGSGAAGPARHTFVVGGRRATPYAALLAMIYRAGGRAGETCELVGVAVLASRCRCR